MVPNLGRKLTTVALALGISILLLVLKDPPFRLGLDLQGGTRLSYRFDFEEAIREGTISEQESLGEILQQTIAIIYNRVDPDGVLEPIIRTEGTDRIVIELPGRQATEDRAQAPLAGALAADGRTLVLDAAAAREFPENGGIVRVGDEQMRYATRNGDTLAGLVRGHLGTTPAAHADGASVQLVSDDAIRNKIENLGELQFMIVANAGDFPGTGTDEPEQLKRLQDWAAANPGTPIEEFNRVPEADGGPHPMIRWFPNGQLENAEAIPEVDRAMALLVQGEDFTFRGSDLGRVYYTQDSLGYPAVGFEMQPARISDFTDFTSEHLNRRMGIVLNGVVATAPSLDDTLPGRGIIRGQFTQEEVKDLVTVLRTGSLKIKPILEAEEVVGPTLGEGYVKLGFTSAGIGLLAVLAFMIFYYRRLGVFSAISLAATMLMLLGGLAVFQATLTLPGIAGIILTVGMAVDANILIFDRIREEMDKGRNVKQAAKNGFDNALSTIVDANLTTLITAIVLYKVGTGPVRGFAVTLSVGILASMFAALVITRLLVHYSLEKKDVKPFTMGTWLVEAKGQFMAKSKAAIAVSSVLILGGVGLFATLPSTQKLGIDFLGGGTVMFRTEEPHAIEDIRARIRGIEGAIGDSAEVKPVNDSAAGGGFTAFRTVFKIGGGEIELDGQNQQAVIDSFTNAVRSEVEELLQKGPIDITMAPDATTADVRLYFDEAHAASAVARRLTDAGFLGVDVSEATDRPNTYVAKLDLAGADELALSAKLQGAFDGQSDAQGLAFRLSNPIPERNLVGAQVVGELQQKAVWALLFSLFAIVMYIKVRFAEYSYGFAAVAALIHDVLITLGVLSVAMVTGLVEVEINLPLIAAFLTIIGYSLNDTIVLFDRVRENLPRVQKPLADVLDLSINQTLSRTILTSITTFLAVAILFALNRGTGNVLEGFAFAMVIGVLVGTYSSIFVASPVLHWLESRNPSRPSSEESSKKSGGKLATQGA